MSSAWPVPWATTRMSMPLAFLKAGSRWPNRPDCSVLVVYALSASHDKPDGDDPRWVYGTPPEGFGLMAAQPAPMSRFMRRAEFFQAVNDAVADPRLEPWAAVHLGEGLGWAAETGCRWFAYMLEPFVIAGDGSAVRLATAAEEAAALPPQAPAVGTADTIAASPVVPQRISQPQPPPVQTGPSQAWSETPQSGYEGRAASGAQRGALLRALSRNIGENGLVVARRAAALDAFVVQRNLSMAVATEQHLKRRREAELVLSARGVPVIDPDWPDEDILDISTPSNRAAIAAIQARAASPRGRLPAL